MLGSVMLSSPLSRIRLHRVTTLCSAVLGTVALLQNPHLQSLAAPVPLTTGTQASLPAPTATRLAALLPGNGQVAQIIKLGSKLTVVELQKRVLEVGGSREALQNVLAVIAKGGMPTYDERLGITRDEFSELSKYLAFQPIFVNTGKTVRLPVTRDAGRVTFADAPGLSILRGLSFDLRSGELRIPEGFTIKAQAVATSAAPDRSLDIKQAFLWDIKVYSAATQNGASGRLWLYHMANGQVVITYKRMSMIKGIPNEGELMIGYQR